MPTPRCFLIPQLAIAVAVTAGCNGTAPNDPVAQYNFTLQAWGRDSTAEHRREYNCLLNGLFTQSTMEAVLRAGPYSVSLAAGERDGGAYIGEWTCGSDVPLAQDSTLLAFGYDADLLAPGSWEVFELQQFP